MPITSPLSSLSSPANTPVWWRVAGAIFYDWIFILALLMVFFGVVVSVNLGHSINAIQQPFTRVGLAFVILGYFLFFWQHGGQTPGMKVWHLHLYSTVIPARLPQLLIRFLVVLFTAGLSLFSGILHPRRWTWHDRLSKTFLHSTARSK